MIYKDVKSLLSYLHEINYKISNIEKEIKEIKKIKLSQIKQTTQIPEKITETEDCKNPKNYKLLGDYTIKTKICPESDYSFSTFKSIHDIIYLIYVVNDKSIIFYDLVDNKKITEIKNAHNEPIYSLKHFYDKINNRFIIFYVI